MEHVTVYQALAWHLEHFLCLRCRKAKDTESSWHSKGKGWQLRLRHDALLGWVWCAAGGQAPEGQGGQGGNHHKIWEVYGQGFWWRGLGVPEGPTWWPITAGKAHPMVWGDTGLQPHHIYLRLPKVKALWDGFQLPAGSGRPGWQKGKAGLNGDCVVLCVPWRAEGKAVILPQLSDKWTSLQNDDYYCHMNAHWESFSADKNTLCVRSNFTLKASSREQDTILTAVEMEHVTGLGYQGMLLKVLSQLFPLLCRHCSVF